MYQSLLNCGELSDIPNRDDGTLLRLRIYNINPASTIKRDLEIVAGLGIFTNDDES